MAFSRAVDPQRQALRYVLDGQPTANVDGASSDQAAALHRRLLDAFRVVFDVLDELLLLRDGGAPTSLHCFIVHSSL